MKSWFNIYIFIALYCLGMVSCTDDSMTNGDTFDKVVVRLTLSVPGGDSRVGGDYQPGTTEQNPYDEDLDENTTLQRYIQDVYILLFENGTNGQLLDFAKATLNGDQQGDVTREIEGQFSQRNGSLDIVVLANLVQNGITPDFESLKGKTEKEVYKTLVYSYPEGGWTLGTGARYLPMWGKKSGVALDQREINITPFNLYRGVAKMGVQVDAACTNFTMKEIYVYYVNSEGYCAAPNQTPSDDVHTQYAFPDVPASSTQLTTPIKYTLTVAQAKSFLEQIYLSESNNKTAGNGKQLKVVVGGVYTGPGLVANDATSYYRIDMEDDKDNDGVLAPFDIIRNHSYIFNITAVNNPGTPTPDEALDEAVVGLTVVVEDWTEVPMQGITPQYTLTVDNSTFGFEGLTVTPGLLNVTTDGTTWDYEKSTDVDNTWFTLGDINKEDNSGQISIIPSPNLTGAIRTGYFYVKAGKIGKKITVVQEPGETANCYIVRTPGDYLLKTDIKGNGNGEAWGDDTGETKVDISLGTTGLAVDHVAILWETAEGLVTIKTDKPDDNGLITYTVNDKKDQWKTSVFEPGHGGNALIGGFDENNKLVWSWHIWVVGDFANGIQTEQWVTGYDFMDRYLGAYSNEPGNRSLGLLYQWGRKDPFIGAANVGEVRNHSEIVKASTVNYTVHGVTYNWGDWATGTKENVQNSILNPTKILKSGFLSSGSGINEFDEKALWGTTSSSIDVKENGVKTLYDPCPPGYRVPSVHSWIFKRSNGTTTLYNTNYKWNCRYVPYRGKDGFDANSYGSESFTSNSPYYGFWVDYTVNESSTAPAVVKYNETGYERSEWGTIKDTQKTPLTWLPLGGVYSGTMDEFATVDEYEGWYNSYGYSSLQVNSIIWLNAPSHRANTRPAGIFLHGTEGYRYNNEDNNGGSNNGRHLHELDETDTGLMALPQYAGSVRCIRDKDAVVSANNVISAQNITLNSTNNYSYTVKITAVETWRVSNPGAKWLSITPAKGNIGETTITISSSAPASGSETATITIQFARGGTKEIKVTRQ